MGNAGKKEKIKNEKNKFQSGTVFPGWKIFFRVCSRNRGGPHRHGQRKLCGKSSVDWRAKEAHDQTREAKEE